MWSRQTRRLIRAACEEDLGHRGDITSALLEYPDEPVEARVVAREDGVICGLALGPLIAREYFRRLGRRLSFSAVSGCADGASVQAGQTVARLGGARAAVLAAERVLLNFLGRMSGVATLTRRYVEAARRGGSQARVLDTRKTLPGWRELDRYAVRCGGGYNHRRGLHDAVLIKDNHLAGVPTERLAGVVFDMLNRLAQHAASEGAETAAGPAFVEVEVDSLEQLEEVLKVVGVDIVLLDNFDPGGLRAAVELRDGLGLRGKVELEASGGVSLENIARIAASGVERISVGALTHSAPSLDLGLDL